MARRAPWDEIPDIEYVDAFGKHAVATLYPDGRITIDDLRTCDPNDGQP
jgi:hypothetical protein